MFLLCQRVVCPHGGAEAGFGADRDVVILLRIKRTDEDGRVDQAGVHFFIHPPRDVRIDIETDKGMFFLEAHDEIRKMIHDKELAAGAVYRALDGLVAGEFFFRLVDEIDDFLSTPFEKEPVRGKAHMTTAPVQEFHARFPFKLQDLAGKRRLRDVEDLGRSRDAPFAGDREKVFQNADFHNDSLLKFPFRP